MSDNKSKLQKVEKLYDAIIVGGGPAGLATGIYAGRALLNTLLIQGDIPGGQAAITDAIENYPGFPEGISGFELMTRMQKQAEKFGITIVKDKITHIGKTGAIFELNTKKNTYKSKAVILTSGTIPRKINVPGEEEFTGKGVSYCATCDAAFFKNKTVAVVGGGDSAVKEALFLTKFVDKLYLIHRRDKLRAEQIIIKRLLENPKVKPIWNCVPTAIKGGSKVESIEIKNLKDNTLSKIDVDGVFVFIGNVPKTEMIKENLNLDKNGYIITDENMATTVPGLFVAGDIRSKMLRQVTTAVSDGAIAAISAEHYLESKVCVS